MKEDRERDLVLAPNEFAYVSDRTKGNVDVYVGPHKASLSQTDQLVIFSDNKKRFQAEDMKGAIQTFAIAPEGWYITLKNPAADNKHPLPKTSNSLADLQVGHKVNIPGPASFALWPGQMIRVLKGHQLRSNQYLVARVYDEEAAKRDWSKAVIVKKDEESIDRQVAMGELIIIQGTDVSFYIPPSGIEVVKENEHYVRNAVTLERLEYCVLLDEDGNKRFIQGPAVVFPEPTETFKTDENGSRKFKAIELNEFSGLYIKVVANYIEKKGDKEIARIVGDELFITGNEQMIYFPREEHAIIKYGKQDIHYAIAIPAGEARYVLDRKTSDIRLEHGPSMLLPDPRNEVIIKRMLDPKIAKLWFPESVDAVAYNQALMETMKEEFPDATAMWMQNEPERSSKVRDKMTTYMFADSSVSASMTSAPAFDPLSPGQMTEEFERKQKFTEPRTIILDTKYDGAIPIDVWTGYAVLVVGRSGTRDVVVGPKRKMLEYDEFLESMTLSAGTPKGSAPPLKTAYLRVLHNKVSDTVLAETRDLVEVSLDLSYRVNFEDDSKKWFDVEDYVKFLTDHLRSMVKGVVKAYGIEDFYENAITILRDSILGKQDAGERPGRTFSENGMKVYDVEVLNVDIENEEIGELLVQSQIATVEQTLTVKSKQRALELLKTEEEIERESAHERTITYLEAVDANQEKLLKEADFNKEKFTQISARRKEEKVLADMSEKINDLIHTAGLQRTFQTNNEDTRLKEEALKLTIKSLEAEAKAIVEKGKAYSPDLIASLNGIVNLGLSEKIVQSVSIPALLGGKDVVDVFTQLFGQIPQMGKMLKKITPNAD